MTYSHMGTPTLPSALLCFTSEFGMGSGGATALLSSDKNCINSHKLFSRLHSCKRLTIWDIKTHWVLYG